MLRRKTKTLTMIINQGTGHYLCTGGGRENMLERLKFLYAPPLPFQAMWITSDLLSFFQYLCDGPLTSYLLLHSCNYLTLPNLYRFHFLTWIFFNPMKVSVQTLVNLYISIVKIDNCYIGQIMLINVSIWAIMHQSPPWTQW